MKGIAIILSFLYIICFQESFEISGKYKVISYQKSIPEDIEIPEYLIEFQKTSYTKHLKNGEKLRGSIRRLKVDNLPIIVYLKDSVQEYHPKTRIDSLLFKSKGYPIMEFNEEENDTIKFRTTFEYNLHVTIVEGFLVKQ